METNELKIQIPEGYCVDESKSTFEKIVFKKKYTKPRSWEEYLKRGNHPDKQYFIDNETGIVDSTVSHGCIGNLNHCSQQMKSYLPTKELAEAFLAMMQLMSLRQAWIGDWKPDWNGKISNYCIIILDNKCNIDPFFRYCHSLSFPTKEMAKDFMECFKDLLNVAKPLI